MKRIVSLVLVCLLAGPAVAQESGAPPPPPESNAPAGNPELSDDHFLLPGNLDARFTVDTDVLVVYMMLGASADFGFLRVRPGTLAIGGGVDYGFCGSLCLAFNAITPFHMGQQHLFPNVRLSYHLPLPRGGSLTNKQVNLYVLAYAGPVMTWWGLEADDGTVKVEGNDVSVGVGAGVGAQYFFSRALFVGAEATGRYARGRYTWRVTVGNYNVSGNEDTWDLSGFNVRLMVGLRLM